MLIVSQDETLQVEHSNGMWQAQSGKVYWLSLNNTDAYIEYGKYTNQEKAIKVLGMIKSYYKNIINSNCRVFQIPQDSEVTV